MGHCVYVIETSISGLKNDTEPDFMEKLNNRLKDVGAQSPFKYIIREGQCKEVENFESITVQLKGIDDHDYSAVVSVSFNDYIDTYVSSSKFDLLAYIEKAPKINKFIEEVILPKFVAWVNERCQHVQLTIKDNILLVVNEFMKVERKDIILLELDANTIKFNNYNEFED